METAGGLGPSGGPAGGAAGGAGGVRPPQPGATGEGPMEPDYPAAHSMDTTWYAIDARGNVGVFFSGEDGCVATGGADDDDFFGLVQQLSGGQLDPDEDGGLEGQWERAEDLAIQHGLFLYQYVGEFNP